MNEWTNRFDRARLDTPLTLAEIEVEALEVYQSTLDQMAVDAESGELADGPVIADGMTWQEFWIDSYLRRVQKVLAEQDWGKVKVPIATIGQKKGVTVEPGSKTFATLARAILMAKMAAYQGRLKLLRGEPSEKPVTFLGAEGIDPHTLQPWAPVKRPMAIRTGGLRLLTEHTRGQHESVYRLFEKFTGDAALASIDKSQAADFLDHVAKERSLSNRTLNRYTSTLSAVWN